ncbi:MAG: hypothetical protein AAF791_08185 [Bacteroidota bacterium]
MIRRLAVVCAIVLGTALAAAATERPAERLRADLRAAEPTASDTLRYEVRAGETLIVALPTAHDGREVSYRLLEAPALSWLVDRSFMWRTTPNERGRLAVQIERRTMDEALDALVLLVDLVE